MRLNQLPMRQRARITAIDWSQLGAHEGRRLRELGFDEDVLIELLHRGPLGKDPIACRVGRMTIAMRLRHAAAITGADGGAGGGGIGLPEAASGDDGGVG